RRGKITGDKMGLPRILKTARKIHAQETLNKIKIRNDVIVDRSHVEVEFALKNRKKNPFLRFDFESHVMPASKIAIRVGALNIGYGERRLWEKDLNWTVQGFQRWHLRGLNGSGKTSLLKVLANKLEVATVTKENIFMVQNYCYLDQNLSLLDHDRSVMENIVEESRFDEKQIRNELAFFGFTNDQALQKVKTLSGGELLRAGLAKMFLGKQIPELVLLDEPTNNLDLASIVYLEKALKEYRGALVVVSHDLKFVESLEITHELWVETGLMKQID
ncbi:MAG: ATP-binding cassette domain-containing protein, partial [Pseudobdellovibrionaceae bacterium]